MKRGKEIAIKLPYNYKVVSGTVNNVEPKSVYVQISAWGKPQIDNDENYDRIIRQKSKRVKNKLYEIVDPHRFYKDKTIVDFNMASSGISFNKRSFMCVECTLFQKEPFVKINDLKETLTELSESLINDVFETDTDFKWYLTKKGE